MLFVRVRTSLLTVFLLVDVKQWTTCDQSSVWRGSTDTIVVCHVHSFVVFYE